MLDERETGMSIEGGTDVTGKGTAFVIDQTGGTEGTEREEIRIE